MIVDDHNIKSSLAKIFQFSIEIHHERLLILVYLNPQLLQSFYVEQY